VWGSIVGRFCRAETNDKGRRLLDFARYKEQWRSNWLCTVQVVQGTMALAIRGAPGSEKSVLLLFTLSFRIIIIEIKQA